MALVRGISSDLDGCFLNEEFRQNPDGGVVPANREILNLICDANPNYKFTKWFVGSCRQSLHDDKANGHINTNGSGYPRVVELAQAVDAVFDDYLLADLYNDKPAGTSFKLAIECLDERKWAYRSDASSYDWLHDKSKLTILYAQIHKLASENPNDEIEFYFFDDMKTILDNLQNYFQRFPHLIPKNVKLNLIRYEGAIDKYNQKIEPLTTNYHVIQGTGNIDFQYEKSIKDIARSCIESPAFRAEESSGLLTGRFIKSYEDAQVSGFIITAPLNCIRDYQPPEIKVNSVPDYQPVEIKASSCSSSSSSFFRTQPRSQTRKTGFLDSRNKTEKLEELQPEESEASTSEDQVVEENETRNSWPPTIFTPRPPPANAQDRTTTMGRHRSFPFRPEE